MNVSEKRGYTLSIFENENCSFSKHYPPPKTGYQLSYIYDIFNRFSRRVAFLFNPKRFTNIALNGAIVLFLHLLLPRISGPFASGFKILYFVTIIQRTATAFCAVFSITTLYRFIRDVTEIEKHYSFEDFLSFFKSNQINYSYVLRTPTWVPIEEIPQNVSFTVKQRNGQITLVDLGNINLRTRKETKNAIYILSSAYSSVIDLRGHGLDNFMSHLIERTPPVGFAQLSRQELNHYFNNIENCIRYAIFKAIQDPVEENRDKNLKEIVLEIAKGGTACGNRYSDIATHVYQPFCPSSGNVNSYMSSLEAHLASKRGELLQHCARETLDTDSADNSNSILSYFGRELGIGGTNETRANKPPRHPMQTLWSFFSVWNKSWHLEKMREWLAKPSTSNVHREAVKEWFENQLSDFFDKQFDIDKHLIPLSFPEWQQIAQGQTADLENGVEQLKNALQQFDKLLLQLSETERTTLKENLNNVETGKNSGDFNLEFFIEEILSQESFLSLDRTDKEKIVPNKKRLKDVLLIPLMTGITLSIIEQRLDNKNDANYVDSLSSHLKHIAQARLMGRYLTKHGIECPLHIIYRALTNGENLHKIISEQAQRLAKVAGFENLFETIEIDGKPVTQYKDAAIEWFLIEHQFLLPIKERRPADNYSFRTCPGR